MSTVRPFHVGRARPVLREAEGSDPVSAFELPPHHLVTHGVVVGMTGSGKTGLCLDLVEEAVRSRIPVLLLDVKGDLPNVALAFERLDAASFLPWVDVDEARRKGQAPEQVAEALASKWRDGLAGWGLGEREVAALRASMSVRVITPGTTSGEPLHVLSPLELPTDLWHVDEEAAREALSAAVSLLLRMIKRDPDPTRGREHVLLSLLAERRLRGGHGAGLEALLADLQAPPIDRVGALSLDEFLGPKDRASLATDLNALVASPTFSSWRKGAPLDVGAWLSFRDERVPVTIVSVAHLEDEERMLVLGLVLEQALAWVRGLSGTSDLRAMILFDEVFGFLPPHPANPPTKRPLLALLKQARAFGVGCVLATQNPMDLDYKALSNAGAWFVGRLSTDADRARVVDGLVGSEAGGVGLDAQELAAIVKALPPRAFFVRDVHAGRGASIVETRWTLSWLRGPMTRREIRRLGELGRIERALEQPQGQGQGQAAPAPAAVPAPAPAITAAPPAPETWRTLFPYPPAAPVDAWSYHPHAAVIARADVADAKLGIRLTREVGVMIPIAAGTLDLDRAVTFDPDALAGNQAVPGARFVPYAEGPLPTRAVRALEKALEKQAATALRVSVLVNDALGLVAQPGESPAAFAERCQQAARAEAMRVRSDVLAKHDPRIRKLTVERDGAHRAASGVGPVPFFSTPRDRDRHAKAKRDLVSAQAALDEAVRKRDAELSSKETEALRAALDVKTKELVPKKDAVTIEAHAIVWAAG